MQQTQPTVRRAQIRPVVRATRSSGHHHRRATIRQCNTASRTGDAADSSSTCATFLFMSTVGVRELRQNASEILRAVEAGESATVTVAGRPVAQIVPISPERWTTWERIRHVFDSPTDSDWDAERREFGASGIDDPWAR